MSSFIADNLEALSLRHYIRKAGADDYWFDFTQNKLEKYKSEFGDDFCHVLYASDTDDDSYVLPYSHVKHLFAAAYVNDRKRWVGNFGGNLLRVRHSNQTMSVSAYYNAFGLVQDGFRYCVTFVSVRCTLLIPYGVITSVTA